MDGKNSKMAGAFLKAEYDQWREDNRCKPSDAAFGELSTEIKGQLRSCGMGDKDIDGAVSAAKNNKVGFPLMRMIGVGNL